MPDGELNFVQDPDDFPEGNPCGKLKLEEVACDTFAGFVWLSIASTIYSGVIYIVAAIRMLRTTPADNPGDSA